MGADRNRLLTVLAPVVTAAGYDLEDIELSGAGRRTVLRVLVDRDGGFGLDDVADLSRDVSTVLDEAPDLIPGTYVLEVSSPGVGRPLTHPRHWRRNIDRLVEVRFRDGDAMLLGRIRSADDHVALVDVDGESRDIAYERVERATVQVELRRPRSAAAPGGAARAGAGEAAEPDGDDAEVLDDLDELDDPADLEDAADLDDLQGPEEVRDGH